MTSAVEITCLFAETLNNHTKVAGTPNDNHVIAFKEYLLSVCLQIASKGTNTGNSSSAILEYARYQAAVVTNVPYDCHVAARANYDSKIQADNPALRSKEETWVASTRNQSRKRAIKRGANDYLLSLVNLNWIRPLINETTFFTRVTPVEMFSKLTKAIGGLKRVYTVDLLFSLTELWEQEPRVPEYLNDLRGSHKK